MTVQRAVPDATGWLVLWIHQEGERSQQFPMLRVWKGQELQVETGMPMPLLAVIRADDTDAQYNLAFAELPQRRREA